MNKWLSMGVVSELPNFPVSYVHKHEDAPKHVIKRVPMDSLSMVEYYNRLPEEFTVAQAIDRLCMGAKKVRLLTSQMVVRRWLKLSKNAHGKHIFRKV